MRAQPAVRSHFCSLAESYELHRSKCMSRPCCRRRPRKRGRDDQRDITCVAETSAARREPASGDRRRRARRAARDHPRPPRRANGRARRARGTRESGARGARVDRRDHGGGPCRSARRARERRRDRRDLAGRRRETARPSRARRRPRRRSVERRRRHSSAAQWRRYERTRRHAGRAAPDAGRRRQQLDGTRRRRRGDRFGSGDVVGVFEQGDGLLRLHERRVGRGYAVRRVRSRTSPARSAAPGRSRTTRRITGWRRR